MSSFFHFCFVKIWWKSCCVRGSLGVCKRQWIRRRLWTHNFLMRSYADKTLTCPMVPSGHFLLFWHTWDSEYSVLFASPWLLFLLSAFFKKNTPLSWCPNSTKNCKMSSRNSVMYSIAFVPKRGYCNFSNYWWSVIYSMTLFLRFV